MDNKKHIIAFILIITVFLVVFQYMIMTLSGGDQTKMLVQLLINLPICIVIGLVDFGIIHTVYVKYKFRTKTYVRITLDLMLTAIAVAILSIVANYVFWLIQPDKFQDGYNMPLLLPLILWNSIIVLLIEIFLYNQRQIDAEKKIALIEKEKLHYQYETLKAQINPHFLFNCLNVLSSLAYEDPQKANLFAKKMSTIYRYLLITNERPTVTLKEELLFLESYIYLEEIRFEGALHIDIKNKGDVNKQLIPVSLQLLVENAIKHNVSTSRQPLSIRIEITNERIIVSNNLQLRSTVDKGGVGLKNLREQYALYNQAIEVINTGVEFIVKIPFIE